MISARASGVIFTHNPENGKKEISIEAVYGLGEGVAAARAMINNPRLIIADEPTANLESKQALSLFELLHDYAKQSSCGLLVATHDQRILPFADRILRLEDGLLAPHPHLKHYVEA